MLNLVVPLMIMLLIKWENNWILFLFSLSEAQSVTFSHIKHQGHVHTAVHRSGTGEPGLRKIGNTSRFWEMITMPTHVYKLVESSFVPWIKLILMQLRDLQTGQRTRGWEVPRAPLWSLSVPLFAWLTQRVPWSSTCSLWSGFLIWVHP